MGTVADHTPLLPEHEASARGWGKSWADAQSDVLKRIQAAAANPTHKTYLWVGIGAGLCCGLVAYVYSTAFQSLLDLVWVRIPEHLVLPALYKLQKSHGYDPDSIAWVYTVVLSTLMGTLAGLVQSVMGSPGDLPETIAAIHEKGYLPIRQSPSMFLCSSFSIAAGGSLGPEAPLLALCAATTSWLGRKVLGYRGAPLRNCALIGMSAGLSAFFGVALGGSLFALEVLHRAGVEFFEVIPFSVCAGLVCLLVFRKLTGEPYGGIWDFEAPITAVDWRHILLGGAAGLVGAAVALVFMQLHKALRRLAHAAGVHEHKTPIMAGALGGLLIGCIGVLLPPVMFWGEWEIQTIASGAPLPHIWPKGGCWGMAPFLGGTYPVWVLVLTCFVKLLAISVTVLAGFRGGFIFPLFMAGASLGRGLAQIRGIPFISDVPPVLLSMSIATGVDVAITRTFFATTLILTTLSGHPEVMVPCLCASLVSLFVTLDFPFIGPQRSRRDIEFKDVEYEEPTEDATAVEAMADAHPLEADC